MKKLDYSESEQILDSFYRKLLNNVLRHRINIEANSVFVTTLKQPKNKISNILNESSIKRLNFPLKGIEFLEDNKLIVALDKVNRPDEYIITAKGIWEAEKRRIGLSEKAIIDFVQEQHFSFDIKDRALDDLEKMIILSMVGARAFSYDHSMHLTDKKIQDYWLDIFKKSDSFLSINGISKGKRLSFEMQGNEHPVSYVMRRVTELPRKTRHIYCFSEKHEKKYYLSLLEEDILSIVKLKYLFSLVFLKIDDPTVRDEIFEFCKSIAHEKARYVIKDFRFIDCQTDVKVREALNRLYLD